MLTVDAIDHVVLNVRNVELSAAWYERVLGMKRLVSPSPTGGPRTSVTFGRNKINLRPIHESQEEWFTGQAPCFGGADLCFLTQTPPPEVAAHFRLCDVTIVLGPTEKSGACGPICSVYVRDPDGNLIEVSSYVDA